MSRHHSSSAYGFSIRYLGRNDYRLSWAVDYYYPTSPLRFPRRFYRNTDKRGAARFARKHNVAMPERPSP